jgi:hypothetical protein
MARRDRAAIPDLEQVRDYLTGVFKHTPGLCMYGREDPALCAGCRVERLNEAQAVALAELALLREGLMGSMRVGSGKTLVSLLAATVLGSARPVLCVPASLKRKTLREACEYARHWRVAPMKVITYEWLSNPKQVRWLEEYKPDLFVADEASAMKDPGTKCAKRLSKYRKAHPECVYIDLDGSTAGRSIREFWHRLRWALRSRAPVPADPFEATAWAYAMDEKVPPALRYDPSALFQLSPGIVHDDPMVRARMAFRDRFVSTPAVISTLEDKPDVGLRLWTSVLPLPPEAVEAIETMRKTWCTPDGHPFKYAVQMWAHCQELGSGLVYVWDPRAPAEWLKRKSDWYKFVRECLKHSRTKDSSVHIVEAIEKGELDDGGLLARWREIKPTFTPNPVPIWVHSAMLDYCAAWLKEHPRGIVWTPFRAFGERLERETDVPYFGRKAEDSRGRSLDGYHGPAIASLKAGKKGLNLQFTHSDNLFHAPPSKGDWVEQALGRTHRGGQTESLVTGEFVLTCRESYQSLAQAERDAFWAQQTLAQPQKLVYADKDFEAIGGMDPDEEDSWKEKGV